MALLLNEQWNFGFPDHLNSNRLVTTLRVIEKWDIHKRSIKGIMDVKNLIELILKQTSSGDENLFKLWTDEFCLNWNVAFSLKQRINWIIFVSKYNFSSNWDVLHSLLSHDYHGRSNFFRRRPVWTNFGLLKFAWNLILSGFHVIQAFRVLIYNPPK